MKIHTSFSQSNRGFIIPMAALIIASFLILGVFATVFANGQNGSIWTTDDSNTYQDKNEYNQGEQVYIRGENLDPNTEYTYEVTGLPGGASTDPNQTVASGQVQTDDNGNFIIPAYIVQNDDSGEYKVSVGNKQDNYRVNGTTTQDPTEDPTEEPTEDPTEEPTEEPTQTPPTSNPPLNPPTTSNPLFLIPVTGIDRSSRITYSILSLAAFMAGIGLIIIGKQKQ